MGLLLGSLFKPSTITNSGTPLQTGLAYSSLANSNPYRGLSYKKSPWQNFLSKLGFRTQADAWQENMQVQANEYDAALAQKIYDEQYNDPSAQVNRMKAAGLNPDLDPSTIDSGQAQPFGEDPSTPMVTTGDEGLVMDVVNGCMSAFTSALGMVQTLQGIQGNRMQNSILGFQEGQALSDFALNTAGQMLPASAHPDDIENYDWKAAAMDNVRRFAGVSLTPQQQKKYVAYMEDFWNSAVGESESYEDFKNRISSRKSYEGERLTFWSEIPDVLFQIINPLSAASERIYKATQKAQELGETASAAGSQTEIAYQNEVNGELMGAAVNASNQAQSEKDSTAAILNGVVNDIVSSLKQSSKEGGIKGGLSTLALMGITGIQLWLSSVGMPSVSRSSYHKEGGTAESSSESLSW